MKDASSIVSMSKTVSELRVNPMSAVNKSNDFGNIIFCYSVANLSQHCYPWNETNIRENIILSFKTEKSFKKNHFNLQNLLIFEYKEIDYHLVSGLQKVP